MNLFLPFHWLNPRRLSQLFFLCALLLSVLTASAQVIYVTESGGITKDGTSWATAYAGTALQGILANPANTTVLVASGLYKPTTTTDRFQSFTIASGVQVYGGYTAGTNTRTTNPSSTTLSGDIDNNNTLDNGNSQNVVLFKNASSQTRLDGVVITGGNANDGPSTLTRSGGGVCNDGSGSGNMSNPTLVHCTFVRNEGNFGGGMFNNGQDGGTSNPTLIDCSFQENRIAMMNYATFGGTSSPVVTSCSFTQNIKGIYSAGEDGGTSSPVVTNCSFTRNTANAIDTESYTDTGLPNLAVCNPVITNCSFIENTIGSAVYNSSTNAFSTVLITNCRFIRNETDPGPGGAVRNDVYNQGNLGLTMINCSFIGNRARLGGAVFNGTGNYTDDLAPTSNHSTLINCSFYQNTATEGQGNAIYDQTKVSTAGTTFPITSTHSLINCIFWENGGANAFYNETGENLSHSLAIDHSLIETGATGFTDAGNNLIGQYPQFIDAANDDLRLNVCSPAINAGSNSATALSGTTTDLAGNARFFNNGTVDPGAYEFQGAAVTSSGINSLTVIQNAPPISLTITGCSGTVAWSGPNNTSGTGTTISVPTSAIGTLVYSATCTIGSCASPPGSATVTVLPALVSGSFDGFIYGADCSTFRGWAWDRNKPNTPVSIDILDGGTFIASLLADQFRSDLQTAGKGNGKHAFSFTIPTNLKNGVAHSLSARVSGSSFILKDSPKALICEGIPTPGGNKPPQPPSPTVLIAPLVAQVGVPFSGTLVPFTDPENQPLTYGLTGLPDGLSISMTSRVISGTPTVAGTYVLTYSATDSGPLTNSVSFALTVNPASTTTVTGSFEGYLDKVECGTIRGWVWDRNKPNTPLTVEIYSKTAGGIETVWGSTVANIYRDDLKNAGKGNGSHAYSFTVPIGLKDGVTRMMYGRVLGSTYLLKDSGKPLTCNSPTRLSAETGSELQVTVLGNPVSEQVDVEIRGAEGKPLRVEVTTIQGQVIGLKTIQRAAAIERQQLNVSHQPAGMLFLRVSTPGQNRILKLLKP